MKEEKAALRRAINERISALDEEYLRESDRGIWENVLSLPEFSSAGTVFAYLSVDRECDTRRIVDQLLQEGRRVALPRSRKGGVMDFALYDGTLAEGMYGIPQPPDEAETVEPGEGTSCWSRRSAATCAACASATGAATTTAISPAPRPRPPASAAERLLRKSPTGLDDFASASS